jgi:hypothetical protein
MCQMIQNQMSWANHPYGVSQCASNLYDLSDNAK